MRLGGRREGLPLRPLQYPRGPLRFSLGKIEERLSLQTRPTPHPAISLVSRPAAREEVKNSISRPRLGYRPTLLQPPRRLGARSPIRTDLPSANPSCRRGY